MIYLDFKIPHLQIAHQGGNLKVGNIKIHLSPLSLLPTVKNFIWKIPMMEELNVTVLLPMPTGFEN